MFWPGFAFETTWCEGVMIKFIWVTKNLAFLICYTINAILWTELIITLSYLAVHTLSPLWQLNWSSVRQWQSIRANQRVALSVNSGQLRLTLSSPHWCQVGAYVNLFYGPCSNNGPPSFLTILEITTLQVANRNGSLELAPTFLDCFWRIIYNLDSYSC
jgi:hypothetical protein